MLLTFDCYGTLIDWETGILRALREAWPESAALDDRALLDEFHEIQNRLKTDAYRRYRALLTEVSVAVAREHGWDDSEARAATIPASIPEWRPFDDTNSALGRLRDAGATLGILSNIDDDLLAGTLRRFDVAFDRLGTAERLHSYKPATPHFELGLAWAREDADGEAGWLHIAQSLFHDIEPATRLGLRAVWVNRRGEELPTSARPLHTAHDLAAAVDWILGERLS